MDFEQLFNFLAHLQIYNERYWFNEHKGEYERARETFTTLIDALIPPLIELDESIGMVTASECMFRIYRDIRFSPDKTPYKTHMGAFIANGGRKTRQAGYYIHLKPDESFISGGIYSPDAATLESIRNYIYYHPDEIRAILDNKPFKKLFPELSEEDKLKNPPRGYTKECKEIELIKNKHFITYLPLDDDFFMQENVIERLMELFKVQYPFNAFLNKAIQ
ncbi:MAG: DUF2461 domain-containing protein [Bacteroidota bacterium]|jgi:uncharacterized protein (TIGR02453 family)|nr:DUF2461 domain-containing protein [Bacteroidota bacterium]HHU97318.1 DUF2461 domain-containing protein [Petrimonas sp.]